MFWNTQITNVDDVNYEWELDHIELLYMGPRWMYTDEEWSEYLGTKYRLERKIRSM